MSDFQTDTYPAQYNLMNKHSTPLPMSSANSASQASGYYGDSVAAATNGIGNMYWNTNVSQNAAAADVGAHGLGNNNSGGTSASSGNMTLNDSDKTKSSTNLMPSVYGSYQNNYYQPSASSPAATNIFPQYGNSYIQGAKQVSTSTPVKSFPQYYPQQQLSAVPLQSNLPAYSYQTQMQYQEPGYSYGNHYTQGYAHGNFKREDFISDLSPTVLGVPSKPKEDKIEHEPIVMSFNQQSQFSNGGFNDKEVFTIFQERLKSCHFVKLIRTNTLPKEVISRNITIVENNNKKVYFNFEYPTVSIDFQKSINSVTLNWSPADREINKRKLVMFYWEFSLVKANHVINKDFNNMEQVHMGQDSANGYMNENLEYIRSNLHLNYEVITSDEYKYLFEENHTQLNSNVGESRIQFLQSIIKFPNSNYNRNTFCIISCLYWNYTNDFYLTSVDLLFLLDKLSGRTCNISNNTCNPQLIQNNEPINELMNLKKNKNASKAETRKLKQAAKLIKINDSKEINRIRRNLLNFKSITLGKSDSDYAEENGSTGSNSFSSFNGEGGNGVAGGNNNASSNEEMEFFHTIMNFDNPRPRKIEKKLKVYEWKYLQSALDKIMKKYCVDLKTGFESSFPVDAYQPVAPVPTHAHNINFNENLF